MEDSAFRKELALLEKANDNLCKPKDIKQIAQMQDFFSDLDLKLEENTVFYEPIEKLFGSQAILKDAKGRKFLSYALEAFSFRFKEMAEAVYTAMCQRSITIANQLGQVVLAAWLSGNIRTQINTYILKRFVETAIFAAHPKMSKCFREFLSVFHEKRKKKELTAALALLYEPIIFRYLHSSNPFVRYNALLLFVDAFPLVSQQFTQQRKTEIIQTQMDELYATLKDETPKVRSAAAKSVCRLMFQWWDIFTDKDKFLEYLSEELAYDKTSGNVRKSVIEGFLYLSGRFEPLEYLLKRLHKLVYLLHDPIDAVRLDFMKFLNVIGQLQSVNIFEIIHIDHFIYRMQHDNDQILNQIVKLLQPSLFPPPKEKGKEKTINKNRVSRCLFLMRKSIKAAERFYDALSKFVSEDELVSFIRFLYIWSTKQPELPKTSLKGSDKMALKQFEETEENDLERNEIPEKDAVWIIIANIVESIKIFKKVDKEEVFEGFNLKSLLETVSPKVHSSLFTVVSLFKPTEEEFQIAFSTILSSNPELLSESLKCLLRWNSLEQYFPTLVKTVVEHKDNESLSRAIQCLVFIFSSSEYKNTVVDDEESIRALVEGLNSLLPKIFIKLNLNFEESTQLTEDDYKQAREIDENCCIKVIELSIVLRINLAFLEKNNEDFIGCLQQIWETFFSEFMKSLLKSFRASDLTEETFAFAVIKSLLTIFADLMVLHAFDEERFDELIKIFKKCLKEKYGEPVRQLAIECLSKIVVSLAIDGSSNPLENPATQLIEMLVQTCKSDEREIELVNDMINTLVKERIKKKSIPWLKDILEKLQETDEYSEIIKHSLQKIDASA